MVSASPTPTAPAVTGRSAVRLTCRSNSRSATSLAAAARASHHERADDEDHEQVPARESAGGDPERRERRPEQKQGSGRPVPADQVEVQRQLAARGRHRHVHRETMRCSRINEGKVGVRGEVRVRGWGRSDVTFSSSDQEQSMKTILALVLAVGAVGNAAAQTSVSIGINQPGVYGRIQIGDVPAPALYRPEPVIIVPPRVVVRAAAGLPLRSAGAAAELAPLLRPLPRVRPTGLLRSRRMGARALGSTSIRRTSGHHRGWDKHDEPRPRQRQARARLKRPSVASRRAAAPPRRASPRAASGRPGPRARAARGSGSLASSPRSRAARARTRPAPSAHRPRRRRRGAGWRR